MSKKTVWAFQLNSAVIEFVDLVDNFLSNLGENLALICGAILRAIVWVICGAIVW